MSGVEIAGLALAVLPILIATAEYLRTQRLDARREELMVNLAYETTLLNMHLEKLASSLPDLPDELRAKLLSSHAAQDMEASWNSSLVVHALKSYLGALHEPFIFTLGTILDCLEKLLERNSLGLSKDEALLAPRTYVKLRMIRDKKASTLNGSLVYRVRFALHEARKCAQILDKLRDNNTRLEKMVSLSSDQPTITPEQPRVSHTSVGLHNHLRPLMRTLYEVLGKSWPCDCRRGHEARLCLLQKRDQRRDSMTSEMGYGEKVYFNLLVSLNGEENKPNCRWLESQLGIALQQRVDLQPTRGVRFDLQATSSPVDLSSEAGTIDTPAVTTGATASGRRRSSTTTRKRITTLCHTLLQADRSLCSAQLLFDGGLLWHVNSSQPASHSPLPSLKIQAKGVDTSLASLLQRARKFRPKEKLILSVILANSLLQFCESPWLNKEWSKEHISFFPSLSKQDVEILRPYLTIKFQNTELEEEIDPFRVHPNPSVLALGILLLEIELESPIEGKRGEKDLDDDGMPTVNSDHFTALRLFEDMSDNLYKNYRQAIAACLKCDFYDEETGNPSLDDPHFRQAIYNTIVRPLEQELQYGFELTPEDLGITLS